MNIDPKSYARLRLVVVAIVGGTLLVIGVVLLVLPGPGVPLILSSLAILGSEFIWARRLLKKAKKQLQDLRDQIKR